MSNKAEEFTMIDVLDIFEYAASRFIAEHRGEAAKAKLAQNILLGAFAKCLICCREKMKTESNSGWRNWLENVFRLEDCRDASCTLQRSIPGIAAAMIDTIECMQPH